MFTTKFGAAVVVGALVVTAAQGPAFAASAQTNVFLGNLVPNVDFLDQSSRDALTQSKSARLKAFALSEARDQTLAGNALADWIAADPVVADAGTVQTGRSVAVDAPVAQAPIQTTPIVDNRLPHGQEDLDLLSGLSGSDFDAAYKARQLDALVQVETDYQDYLAKGDDPKLLALSKRELPKVQHKIAVLRAL